MIKININMVKRILKTSLIIAFLIASTCGVASAKSFVPSVNAIDTIAGFGTKIETSKTLPDKSISFIVETPDQKKNVFDSQTDTSGVATLDLDGSLVTKAGTYKVYMQLHNVFGAESSFSVYPDEVSDTVSTANTSNRSVSLSENVLITVKLKDKYGNAIKGHQVTVISSRESDDITFADSKTYTNQNGEILFEVSGSESGDSIYSILDVTSGKILKSRPKISYGTESSRLSYAGGDFDNMLAVSGSASLFSIEDVKKNVASNENISFTVTAYDKSGEVATDYTGTVHVSAPGENGNLVELPESDYTFTKDDMGTHIYSLGMKFLQEGKYVVEARDVDDFDISGEIEITVGSGVAKDAGKQISEEYEFTFSSPVSGTYGESVQTLEGIAPPGYTIGFYDGDEEFGVTEADTKGKYSFPTTPLASGEHVFVAVLLDENSEVLSESDPVTITIDTTPPNMDQFSVSVSESPAGSSVPVTVNSEENLSSAKVSVSGQNFELQADPSSKTTYKGTIQAPATPGAYDINVTLADALGNEASYTASTKLTVTDALHPAGLENEISSELPAVSGLSAVPSNARVTLMWNPVQSSVGIKNYRVYYGLAQDKMTYAIDTLTNTVTWYIPNLQNGVKYYFAVTAVDNLGNEGKGMSNIVESTPFSTQTFSGLAPVNGAPYGYYAYPYMTAQTGPEILWPVMISVFASLVTFRRFLR